VAGVSRMRVWFKQVCCCVSSFCMTCCMTCT
jgi:hypothetical protein